MEKIIYKNIKNLLLCTNRERRREFYYLSSVLFISSVLELIMLSAIVPLVMILSNPKSFFTNEPTLTNKILELLHLNNATNFACAFIVLTILNGYFRVKLTRLSVKFSYNLGSDFSNEIYKRTLLQDYEFHINNNTSKTITSITVKVGVIVGQLVLPMLNILTSMIILLFIIVGMIAIEPFITTTLFVTFSLTYLLFAKHYNARLSVSSNEANRESTRIVKLLQESLGGIRDITLNNSYKYFLSEYQAHDRVFQSANESILFIALTPRHIIETIGIVGIALLGLFLSLGNEATNIFAILALLVLGIQRMLPLINQIYNGWTLINGSKHSVSEILSFLNNNKREIIKEYNISFHEKLALNNISFKYNGTERAKNYIFENYNLEIKKGEKLGIKGRTGSGKTTLIDLICGLVSPTIGNISVDQLGINNENQAGLRKLITYVPQNIYLVDDTIEKNIAFGVPEQNIDINRVITCAKLACLEDVIDSFQDKYQTIIGEKGLRISGGQRQRIGIARALYKGGEILILDEATSALDTETENKIMSNIYRLGESLTVIIVAHRISTLSSCDRVIEIL